MKKILSLTFLVAFIGIKAQNNLVVFSENGEKFFLIINGVKQNLEAETNVKVTDLIQPNYKAKIVFEDKSKGVVDQNIYFMQAAEPVKNHEFVYSVGIKKKGGYKARPVSAVAIGQQTKADPEQTVVHYSTTEPTATNNNVVSDGNTSSAVHVADDGTTSNSNTNVNVDQTITQTKVAVNDGGANNTNVNVNMSGLGVNVSVSDNMGGMGNTTTTSSQMVTTTTKTSGGVTTSSSANTKTANSNAVTTKNSTATSSTKASANVDGYEKTSTTVSSACTTPMSNADFDSAIESINTASTDDTKLKIAKQVVDANCVSTEQVKEMINQLSFEEAKLKLAKHGYTRVTDKRNYYKINDALTFESSKSELDTYINSTKKASSK